MLNFYINRAGSSLPVSRKRVLTRAKGELKKLFITHYLGDAMSLSAWLVPLFYNLVSFIVVAGLFALLFKVLPDVRLQWRDVAAGSIGTALLFLAGKYLLSLYLRQWTSY